MGSPAVSPFFAQRVIVGVGDVSVSNNPAITLSTYGLGSCVAVAVYDPVVKAGGLLHLMLPESRLSPEKAMTQPAMFADTGLPLLFRSLAGLKAAPARMRVFLAGGASMLCQHDTFRIGERNLRATSDFLELHGVQVQQFDVGGTVNRTVHLDIATGSVTLKTPQVNETWSLAA